MRDKNAVMVGLIGAPPVAIFITPAEIETLRAAFDRLAPVLHQEVRESVAYVLRQLDIRLGACAALFGDGADLSVPLVPDELEAIRRAHAHAAGVRYAGPGTDAGQLMAALHRRVGAAQARLINGAGHRPQPQHKGTADAAVIPIRREATA
jgi:hypothetical protein